MSRTTKKRTTTPKPPALPPELAEFQAVEAEMLEFREAYPEVFQYYADLVQRYNTKLEAAEKAVRGMNVEEDVGPFHYLRTVVKYDSDALHEILGPDAFKECGGRSEQKTVFTIDPQRFDAKAATSMIPPDVVARVRTKVLHYNKPRKLTP